LPSKGPFGGRRGLTTQEWWFVLSLLLVTVAAIGFYREELLGGVLAPWALGTATVTAFLLDAFGIEAVRIGSTISEPEGFGYLINYSCTGILPLAFLTVGIAAFPADRRSRLIGLAIAGPVLLTLNQIRLVHLFHVGSTNLGRYDFMHLVVWEWVIVGAVLGLWMGWVIWAENRERGAVNGELKTGF